VDKESGKRGDSTSFPFHFKYFWDDRQPELTVYYEEVRLLELLVDIREDGSARSRRARVQRVRGADGISHLLLTGLDVVSVAMKLSDESMGMLTSGEAGLRLVLF
jgi:hypothetical protein